MAEQSSFIIIASLLVSLAQAAPEPSSHNVTTSTKSQNSVSVMDNPIADTNVNRKRDTSALAEREYELKCLIPHQGSEPDMDHCLTCAGFLRTILMEYHRHYPQTLLQCVYNGHDGLLEDPNNDIVLVLAGTEAAPPYDPNPNCP